jgi:hypothetical protein
VGNPNSFGRVGRPTRQVCPKSPSTISLPTQLPTKQSAVRPVQSGPTHPARYLSPHNYLPHIRPSLPSSPAQITQHDNAPPTSCLPSSRSSLTSSLAQLTQHDIPPHPPAYQTVGRPSRQVWPNSPTMISLPTQIPTKQSSVRPVKSGPTHPP